LHSGVIKTVCDAMNAESIEFCGCNVGADIFNFVGIEANRTARLFFKVGETTTVFAAILRTS